MSKKIITPKLLTVLHFLYRFRFLNRLQIQLLLNHKTPNRINSWLQYLTHNKFIGRYYLKTYGENNKLAIYHLETPSKKILENKPGVNNKQLIKIYKENTRSDVFRDTCVAMGDCYLYFLAFGKQNENTMNFYTKADQATNDMTDYMPHTLSGAFFSLSGKTETKHYFAEYIDARMSKVRQKGIIEIYIKYSEEGTWETYKDAPFPIIFIICSDEKVERSIRRFTKQQLEDTYADINFYTTIQKNITYNAEMPRIWTKAG